MNWNCGTRQTYDKNLLVHLSETIFEEITKSESTVCNVTHAT